MSEALSIVVFGPPGSGKSWLGATAPGPRLVIDAEGGSRFTQVRKIKWDPATQPMPTDLDADTTVLVSVTDWALAESLHRLLLTGQHPFRSIIVDTLTELQSRLIDHVAGAGQIKIQGWGDIRRSLEDYVRKLRDLTIHPTRPIDSLILIAQDVVREGKHTPMLSGGMVNTLPQFVDVIGYLFAEGDNRGLLVTPTSTYATKDRTNAFITGYKNPDTGLSVIPAPNVVTMLTELNVYVGDSYVPNTANNTAEAVTTEV